MYIKKATSGIMGTAQYAITILGVIFAYGILGQLPLNGLVMYKIQNDSDIGTSELEQFYETMDFSIFGIDKNTGLVLMIMIFVFGMIALYLGVKYLHKMDFKYLVTPLENIHWNKIFFGFGFWFILAIILEGMIYFLNPEIYSFSFNPGSFIVLLLICIFILPIQTSFEELFFRGYLMPGLAVLTNNKWIPLLIVSILFGLIHSFNPEIEKFGFWTMQFYYISAGIFLGIITILDDSLELALGVHAATNIFGVAILTFDGGVLQTDSLFRATEINPIHMIIVFYIAAAVFIYVCNIKYNWGGFSRLITPVTSKDEIITNVKE